MITKVWTVVAVIFLFATDICTAQRWTIDQLEVWSFITEGWEVKKSKEGDPTQKELEWLEQNLHPEHQSVSGRLPMPVSKAKLLEGLAYDLRYSATQLYLLEPQRILIHEDTAVVHYTFYWAFTHKNSKNASVEPGHRKSLVTTVLVKIKDRWLHLANHISEIE